MYALDAADGHADYPHEVINLLIQALLQYVLYSCVLAYYLMGIAERRTIVVGKGKRFFSLRCHDY